MITTFNTQNIINQSKNAPHVNTELVVKLFIHTRTSSIYKFVHPQLHLGYEDEIQLLLKLQNDSMISIRHQYVTVLSLNLANTVIMLIVDKQFIRIIIICFLFSFHTNKITL